MSRSDREPLRGYRVAVTSPWRAGRLCNMLRRDGAEVCAVAAITAVNLPDDELRRRTEELIAHPPDVLVATTAAGLRGWLDAAQRWGRHAALIAALSGAVTVSNGAKVTGALRAAGLAETWTTESGLSRDIVSRLMDSDVTGLRVAMQLPGATDDWDPVAESVADLCAAGADVVPLRVYRWQPAPRGGEFDQLVGDVADRRFDAICFTSAPAVVATLARAGELGIADELLTALRQGVRAMCVGPATADPLLRLGVPASTPPRPKLGALARHIADSLPLPPSETG